MPYKNKEDRLAYEKAYYKKNKEKIQAYHKKVAVERFKRIKSWFNEYKGSLKCEKCDENHISCLDFHHKDPNKKDIAISMMVKRRYSEKRIMKEISKCTVLCSNCHRKLHYLED